MRTPGQDFDLAAGFLCTEGVIRSRQAIDRIFYCTAGRQPQHYNIVTVRLRAQVPFDPVRLSRYFYTTSSCGMCGKASLEQVRAVCPPPLGAKPPLSDGYFLKLPEVMRRAQSNFARTGGLHAAALFDPERFHEGWGFATGFPRAHRLSTTNQVVDLRAGSHRMWAEACIDSNLNGNSVDLIKVAPAEYFVWRDELESCFRAMDKELDDRAAAITGCEPFESRAFDVDAYVAPADRDVIMECFSRGRP